MAKQRSDEKPKATDKRSPLYTPKKEAILKRGIRPDLDGAYRIKGRLDEKLEKEAAE